MNKLYVLVGVPGSGKSTWIKNQPWALGLTVVSTDSFVEAYAHAQGKTYTEVFKDYMPTAVDLMTQQVIRARELGHSIIWDQTSTTVATRAKKIRMLPDYYKIAVVFETPSAELHAKMLDRPGKEIPDEIVQDMINKFEMPTTAEGFDQILFVKAKS
jgi:predicted kinase